MAVTRRDIDETLLPRLQNGLDALITSGSPIVEVEMSRVTFFTGGAVGALVQAQRTGRTVGVEVAIVAQSGSRSGQLLDRLGIPYLPNRWPAPT